MSAEVDARLWLKTKAEVPACLPNRNELHLATGGRGLIGIARLHFTGRKYHEQVSHACKWAGNRLVDRSGLDAFPNVGRGIRQSPQDHADG
jgi:hypothetical protein